MFAIRKITKKLLIIIVLLTISMGTTLANWNNLQPYRKGNMRSNEPEKRKKYRNIDETKTMTDFHLKTMKEFICKKDKVPVQPIPFAVFDKEYFSSLKPDCLSVTWFGHSSGLIEIEGKIILLDPVFSERVGPTKNTGSRRFHSKSPVKAEQMPAIDFVIISHNHFDHLDKSTIIGLKEKTSQFLVPEGVQNLLIKWGVPESKISVFGWWDEGFFSDIQFVCTPARHFSGRGILDANMDLWCSWVIKGKNKSVYFSGDSGYQKEFKTIGEKFGPFDLAMLECGQYNADWAQIHMFPEEAVQAAIDLKSKAALPIHWGQFSLSVHTWYEPIDRFVAEATAKQQKYITPQIGETVVIDDSPESLNWWKSLVVDRCVD